jgi:hypothetical protein
VNVTSLTTTSVDMSRKRKADIEEARQFSQQSTKLRNPNVQYARFRTFEESGVHEETIVTGSHGKSVSGFEPPIAPNAEQSTHKEPDDTLPKKTQVRNHF